LINFQLVVLYSSVLYDYVAVCLAMFMSVTECCMLSLWCMSLIAVLHCVNHNNFQRMDVNIVVIRKSFAAKLSTIKERVDVSWQL